MALFIKKTNAGMHAPLYTIGAQKNLLIVGLGNVGKEYANTRHNIGFMCVDFFADQQGFEGWVNKKDLKANIATTNIGGVRVILAKPTTFMNNSGEAVQAIAHYYKVDTKDIVVVHDELDVAFAKIRTTSEGSAAGHNGIKSVIAHLGESFERIRVGIGPKKPAQIDSADFVLAKFTDTEAKKLPNITKEVASILSDRTASGSLFLETRSVL